jgi:hypothetical protein
VSGEKESEGRWCKANQMTENVERRKKTGDNIAKEFNSTLA